MQNKHTGEAEASPVCLWGSNLTFKVFVFLKILRCCPPIEVIAFKCYYIQ
ncbi:hypothetical protein HMPREF1705_04715 [Acetomicrobium hydrogeniformans ATCC BAA-1850]|uniref:Uncharacterized protein n=1 Tax=Acetomicrobium hydrogeniformans ATCC BAA-1850 TaxID=592015 RepID=A0A0T5XDH9_9BACT|nr:hypothetical protein HMPREF1705_04715 [Acetomicrobium hydrogeniformans ATCC BAA-1850]